jgi:hypothetical protein
MNDETDFYLSKARNGEFDAAFHGLVELRNDLVRDLEKAYYAETDPRIRSLLVEAVWQHRLPSCADFLAAALEDPYPEVWKKALDGLVTLSSPESRRVLELAKSRMDTHDPAFRSWIEEALDQFDEKTAYDL